MDAKPAETRRKRTVIPKSCMFMPRSAWAGASSILLRFLGCAAALGVGACESGVGCSLAGSGVAVSLPGSSFTDGDFSIEGRGVDGAAGRVWGTEGVATGAATGEAPTAATAAVMVGAADTAGDGTETGAAVVSIAFA